MDFMDESDNSDLEKYGQVKGTKQAHIPSLVADSHDGKSHYHNLQSLIPEHLRFGKESDVAARLWRVA